jgi:hypothetical protein
LTPHIAPHERIENTPGVNKAETKPGQGSRTMTLRANRMTRRTTLRLGALSLGAVSLGAAGLVGLGLAPQAMAQTYSSWPMRLAYARVAPRGFIHIRGEEQAAWTNLQTRLGGLIETIQPMQPADMMGAHIPQVEGGANCALVARQMASGAGFSHVILYATQDGQATYPSDGGWFSDIFANLQADIDKDGRATGEAHLLDVTGGMALASVSADARPRDPLNLLDGGRNPERETLTALTQGMERRLQDMARAAYAAQGSIAD